MPTQPTNLWATACPACGNHVAVDFFNGGRQPLATIAWPSSGEEAAAMRRLPLDFVRCVDCGHIYNASFSYEDVPYADKPNLMFNKGARWADYIADLQSELLGLLPTNPVVVEIGHGDGSFLSSLQSKEPSGRYIGFDPNGATTGQDGIHLRAELFVPSRHLVELKPDLILMRHVLEHLTSSVGFLQQMSFVSAQANLRPLAYFEVPCVDRVLQTMRTVDFYYEHNSQFTTSSFTRMLSRCATHIEWIGHGYDGEVIYGLVRLGADHRQVVCANEAARFSAFADQSLAVIKGQLDEIAGSGKRVAVWGGTGKSAAFIARYAMDAARFPIVVDSDPSKVGTFVPGTGQKILFRDELLANPVEIIVIPPQWRAKDILHEMSVCGISCEQVLIEHQGRLIDFSRDVHPYGESPLERAA